MNDPAKLIAAIRDAHPDMSLLFMHGQCYNLFLILRTVFPGAAAWYDMLEGHVYTKIGNTWWDIRGPHATVNESCKPLSHKKGDRPHRWGDRDTRRLVLVEMAKVVQI